MSSISFCLSLKYFYLKPGRKTFLYITLPSVGPMHIKPVSYVDLNDGIKRLGNFHSDGIFRIYYWPFLCSLKLDVQINQYGAT